MLQAEISLLVLCEIVLEMPYCTIYSAVSARLMSIVIAFFSHVTTEFTRL